MSDPVRPRFDEHRLRFRSARLLAELARVELLVLDKRWTPRRSARLDKALDQFERVKETA